MISSLRLRALPYALGILVWALGPCLVAQALPTTAVVGSVDVDDGPHVIWKGSRSQVFRIRGGRLEVEAAQGRVILALPGVAASPLVLRPAKPLPARAVFPGPSKILALSDIHGRFDRMLELLKAHGVVDDRLRWTFGHGHLVILGDVMDRGPGVTESLWFLKALEGAARKEGGWVHVLLGNHETMVASGDLRYLHRKYAGKIPGLPSQPELYGPESELGRWLRSLPVLLKLGDFLFVHGGISPELLASGLDLQRINACFRSAFGLRARQAEGEVALLLGSSGPVWYRGLLAPGGRPSSTEEEVDQVLARFQVKALVVGHTSLEHVTAFHEGKVFGIDAGIQEGRPGEAWIWEKGRAWRGTAEGGREALQP